jgi:predicted small secreted protein
LESLSKILSPQIGPFRGHISAGMKRAFAALALAAALLASCDNPQKTVDSLRSELREFKAAPDETKQAKIEADFAKLESQIAVLQQRGDVKAEEFREQPASLRGDYQTAKMMKALQDAKSAIDGFGEAFKDTAKGIENAFKDSQTNSD